MPGRVHSVLYIIQEVAQASGIDCFAIIGRNVCGKMSQRSRRQEASGPGWQELSSRSNERLLQSPWVALYQSPSPTLLFPILQPSRNVAPCKSRR